jgi:hypothetical protein
MHAIDDFEYRGARILIHPDEMAHDDSPRDWGNVGTMVCWHKRYMLGDKHDHANPHNLIAELVREVGVPDSRLRELITNLVQQTVTIEGVKRRTGWADYRSNLEGFSREGRRERWHDYLVECLDDGSTQHYLDNLAMECLEENGLLILPLYLYDHSGITMSTSGFSCPWDSGQVGYIYATPETIRKEYGDLSKESVDKARQRLQSEVEVYDQFIRGDVYGYRVLDSEGEEIDSLWSIYGLDEARKMARECVERVAGKPADGESRASA